MNDQNTQEIQELMQEILKSVPVPAAPTPLTEEQLKKVLQTKAMLLDIVSEKAFDFLLEDEETIARANALATTLKNILDIKA